MILGNELSNLRGLSNEISNLRGLISHELAKLFIVMAGQYLIQLNYLLIQFIVI